MCLAFSLFPYHSSLLNIGLAQCIRLVESRLYVYAILQRDLGNSEFLVTKTTEAGFVLLELSHVGEGVQMILGDHK